MGIGRYTASRRSRRVSRRARSQARRKRTFRLAVPVIWQQSERGLRPKGARRAREPRARMQAVSWRTRLTAALMVVFGSPRWISLVLLAGIGVAFYLVGADQAYYVTSVKVSGTATLAREAIIEASQVEGMHIVWVDPAKVAHRVADMPGALTATAEIGWPNQVSITVTEWEPVMVWDQAGEQFWVDTTGRLMRARQESRQMLVVLSQVPDRLQVGDRIPAEVMEGALQLRRERPNIESLFYEPGNGFSYQDGRNWRAYFGVGLDMNQKLVVYEMVVDDLLARGLQPKYISVINKEKPFYSLEALGE